ncbi:zinc finger protein 91-like [Crotalus adamanteus]|uniref:Zinc finger protein 91-like n=1 Tax=Crotalus adamanteus TaxID=8729 RepID=A0AAW1BVA5_CROAD
MEARGSPGAGAAAAPAALQVESGGGESGGNSSPRGLPEGRRSFETERRCFRSCRSREAEGPRALCSRLHRLCRGWLRPERSSKAKMLDLVVLEQLLDLLPPDLAGWLRECAAESCSQAVALAEGFLLGPAATLEPGKGRQMQEPFTGEISAEFQERGNQCSPSQELLFRRIQLGPLQQGLDLFEEVTVDFTEEEWALLDSGQRALCKEVSLEAFRNMAALGDGMKNENEKQERLMPLQATNYEKAALTKALGGLQGAGIFGGSDLQLLLSASEALRKRSPAPSRPSPETGKGAERGEERAGKGSP